MIKSITIFTPDKPYFEVGQKIVRDKKETKVEVLKIKVRFKTVKVYLSDGKIINYRGFPIIYN
jgi:hypothetical protein